MRVSREDLRNLGACQEQCDLFAGLLEEDGGLLEEDGVTSMEVTPEQVWRCLRRGVMAGWLLVLAWFMQPGADLTGANLRGANLTRADLWGGPTWRAPTCRRPTRLRRAWDAAKKARKRRITL